MLDKAFDKCDNLDGLVLHSDQGQQYQHFGYRKRLEEHHIIQSMSRKGNCLDNSMMENFFRIMKSELLYAEKFESPEDFTKALEGYIDYYNNKRIKSRLKGKSPVQYRTLSITGQCLTSPNFWGHFISRTPSLFLEGGYPELAL